MNEIMSHDMRGLIDNQLRIECSMTSGDLLRVEVWDSAKRTSHTYRMSVEAGRALIAAIAGVLPPTERNLAPATATVGGSSSVVANGGSGGEGV